MLLHLLRLLARALVGFPSVLSANWLSVLLPLGIFVAKELVSARKNGSWDWAAMQTHLRRDAWIMACAYLLLFAWSVVLTVYQDHEDLVKTSNSIATEKGKYVVKFAGCSSDLKTTQNSLRDKESLADSFQNAFNGLQGPQAQLQANLQSCISNLAKMNPVIHEKSDVIAVPIGTVDWQGHMGGDAMVMSYINELLIITNEPHKFRGDLWCKGDFEILQPPQIKPSGNAVLMTGYGAPRIIANNEYELEQTALGEEWDPTHPAYLQIKHYEKDLGRCTFTADEDE